MQLTVRAVSKLFKVPEKTVYRWIEQDDLPASLIDGHYGFNRGELVEWATARHISVPDELFKGTDNMVAALPSLAEALQAGGIFHRLKGTDKESVLRSAVVRCRCRKSWIDIFYGKCFLRGNPCNQRASARELPSRTCAIRWCCACRVR